MSQNVTQFVKEADVAWAPLKDPEKVGLVKKAQANIIELFSHTKLQAVMAKAVDRRTMVRYEDARELCNLASGALRHTSCVRQRGHVHSRARVRFGSGVP
jgi:hypothetical protein